MRHPLLTYVVARHNAADMDRRGIRPGFLLRLLTGIAGLATLGLAGAFLAACGAVLWVVVTH